MAANSDHRVAGGDTPLRIQLLGRFAVFTGDRRILDDAWPRRLARAIVKLLALQPDKSMHRERLLDTLWPHLDYPAASANLRKNLHYLRSKLAAAGVCTRLVALEAERLRLAPGTSVDIDDFMRTAELAFSAPPDPVRYTLALDRFEGELLPGDLYEPWTQAPREDAQTTFVRLLVEHGEIVESLGSAAEAAARYRRAIAEDPVNEPAYRGLMRVRSARGDVSGALSEYVACKDALEKELGITPSQETAALARSIRAVGSSVPPPAPTLRFTTTADGVRIAFWTLGSGPPLVMMPAIPITHIAREWLIPEIRAWYQRLAHHRRLICYDSRNTGSSDRGLDLANAAFWELDLEAVIQALAIERFDVFSAWTSTPPAISFAARCPRRVRSLVLWQGHARGADVFDDAGTRIAIEAIRSDWFTYCHLVAHAFAGWTDHRSVSPMASMFEAASTPEDARAVLPVAAAIDATDQLARVCAPTLVLNRRYSNVISHHVPGQLAARIPGARMVTLEGAEGAPYLGDLDELIGVLDAFLKDAAQPSRSHARSS